MPWQLDENDEIETVLKRLTYRMAWQVPAVYLLVFLVERSVEGVGIHHANGFSYFLGFINIIALYSDFQRVEALMPENPWRLDSPIYKKYEQSVSWWGLLLISVMGVNYLAETYGGFFFIILSVLWGMYIGIVAPMRMAWALLLGYFFWIYPPKRK